MGEQRWMMVRTQRLRPATDTPIITQRVKHMNDLEQSEIVSRLKKLVLDAVPKAHAVSK